MALIINGQRVEDAVIEAEFTNIKSYFERIGNVSCCERDDEFREYARQNVIARALLAEEARRAVPVPTVAEVDEALRKFKADRGGDQWFEAMVANAPQHVEDIRSDLASGLQIERMLNDLCARDPAPGDDELHRFYDQNIDSFMTVEQVRASHISKNPKRSEERAAVYDELREVRRKLLAGADFDELARQHSDRGQELIDLGFFKRGELPEEFDLVAFSMEAGELSPVFGSTYGFHIAKVTDRRPPTPRPFEEVRDEVRRLLADQRRAERVKSLVDSLQATATIEDVPEQPVSATIAPGGE